MKVEYYENKDLAIFNGEKFRRDKKQAIIYVVN